MVKYTNNWVIFIWRLFFPRTSRFRRKSEVIAASTECSSYWPPLKPLDYWWAPGVTGGAAPVTQSRYGASLQQALDIIWSERSVAFQSVCDSTVLCLLLLPMRWLCLHWFYRKHFQAQFMWKPKGALMSERQSINVAKIMLCNSRKLCKPTSSYCHCYRGYTAFDNSCWNKIQIKIMNKHQSQEN